MARQQTLQLDLDLPQGGADEQPPVLPEAPAPPPRRPRPRTAARRSFSPRTRLLILTAGLLLLALALVAALYQLDRFLASSPPFVLAGSPEPGADSNLRVEGAVYAPRHRLVRAFAPDFGRSIYLLPLQERRRSLLAIDWVHDATVSRLWPNRVVVRIVERVPVAFVLLPPPGGGPAQAALIDAEGVILEPPLRARFTVPVLHGISPEQTQDLRRQRTALMLALLKEIQPLHAQLSEIDVSDPDNVRITQLIDARLLRLLLGNQRFLPRLKNFLNHYPEIHRRLPRATSFDLRLENTVTAMEGLRNGR